MTDRERLAEKVEARDKALRAIRQSDSFFVVAVDYKNVATHSKYVETNEDFRTILEVVKRLTLQTRGEPT